MTDNKGATMGDAGKAVELPEPFDTVLVDDFTDRRIPVFADWQMRAYGAACAERAEAELRAVWEAMPAGLLYLDPPDGGDVPLAEQVRRMGEDAKAKVRAEAELAALRARVEAAERERDDLRHAIRQHRDTFPDEPLNGELTLWAAIAAQQAEGEDRG